MSSWRRIAGIERDVLNTCDLESTLKPVEAVQTNFLGEDEGEEPKEGSFEWSVKFLTDFGKKSVEEEGLYTGSAAARFMGVSQQRIVELGKLGKLSVFKMPHGVFYSGRELKARLVAEKQKGGRPKLKDHAQIDW